MLKSESIAALSAALAKAQGQMQGAKKDSENPFFKSHYADLASVWEACRQPLSSNGLAVIQTLSNEAGAVVCETMLCHSSGEWVAERAAVTPAKIDAQQYGAVSTYLRRYSLSAIIGGYADDLDAEPDRQAHAEIQAPPVKATTAKTPAKLLAVEELAEKITSSANTFELNARAKKYRPDFDAMTKKDQGKVILAKKLRAEFLTQPAGPEGCAQNPESCDTSQFNEDGTWCGPALAGKYCANGLKEAI